MARHYEDYLRQRGHEIWPPEHPALKRFKTMRCNSVEGLRRWVVKEQELHRRTQTNTEKDVRACPCQSVFVANATLSILNLCCYLLDRQLAALARRFETEGGFTERLYGARRRHREKQG